MIGPGVLTKASLNKISTTEPVKYKSITSIIEVHYLVKLKSMHSNLQLSSRRSTELLVCVLIFTAAKCLSTVTVAPAVQLNCGRVLDVEGDLRSKAPWTAEIFIRSTNDSSYKYLVSGVIIGPNTILTLLGKTYGAASRNGGPYKIPLPKDTIVVAGLETNDINDSDEFTQVVRVSYVLPYTGHNSENKVYHMVLVHLRTPLYLESPYVRSICLNSKLANSVPSINHSGLTLSGYTKLPNSSSIGNLHLRLGQVKISPRTECEALFRKSYEGSPQRTFCGIVVSTGTNDLCILLHGSALVTKVNRRFYLKGLTALIPGKKHGSCDQDTIYFFADPTNTLPWILQNVVCGSTNFTCQSTGKCIPLSKVCNKNKECDDNSDEDAIFCQAVNRCPAEHYPCGLYGLCIKHDNLCDGIKDCSEASDELPNVCEAVRSEEEAINTRITSDSPDSEVLCHPLQTFEGVVAKCMDNTGKMLPNCNTALAGSVATLTCDEQYRSSYRVSWVQMKCGTDGKWGPFKPFACEPECGHISSGFQIQLANGVKTTSEVAFPWYAAIFKRLGDGDFSFICGGSLIERSVVITAGHCVTVGEDMELYQLVFAPISSNYSVNLKDRFVQIRSVKAAFIPASYDPRNLQSDIALIQLKSPVVFDDFVRPICYLLPYFGNAPKDGSIGKIAGLGINKDKRISNVLKYLNFPVISNADCFIALDRVLPLNTFCAGYQNQQTAVCKGDSGGGLVFREPIAGSVRYVLKGVVSHSDLSAMNRLCDTENYSVFTHVDSFADFITETLGKINS